MRGYLKALAAAAALCGLAAANGAAAAPSQAPEPTVQDVYRLGPGDKLRITVYNESSLTGEYSVSSAGTISFPLIGDIPVRDLSVEALQASLVRRLGAGYVKDPKVSAEILNYRPYYILGEVVKPGEYPYAVGLDIVQAVAAAGGYTYRANTRKVFLRRRGEAAETRIDIRRRAPLVLPGDTLRIGERYF